MPLPHLNIFLSITKLFALRMRAHLALGDTTGAMTDFRMALRGYHHLENDPVMISGLVRISMLSMLVAAVGDGLKDHKWTDVELREIEAGFDHVRLWADYRLAMDSEHGFLNTVNDSILRMSVWGRGRYVARWQIGVGSGFADLHGGDSWRAYMLALIPRSVFRENQLRANHYLDELLARVDATNQQIDPDRPTPSALSTDSGDWERFHYFAFAFTTPIYSEIERKYITMQTRLDQVRLACGLERYKIAKGTYPAALTDLVPEFIAAVPNDIYAHAPYHYRRAGTGSFLLYGVGEDRRDDGGKIDPKRSERHQADAIWLYAPPA